MADPQQPITLQYCLIDNCTIIRIDTGQQLDIVYTTQSQLVVTPTDGQTSLLICKNDPELFCPSPNSNNQYIIRVLGLTLLILLSSYTAAVYLMFKELHNTFGKLMIIYSIATTFRCAAILAIVITHYNTAVYSTIPCYLLHFIFMQSAMGNEGDATCILAYLAYVMRHSYKSRPLTKEFNQKLYRYSIVYVLGSLLLFNIFIVSYDFGAGAFKDVILPNGHCDFCDDQPQYDTIQIFHANATINKIIQIVLLVICLGWSVMRLPTQTENRTSCFLR